ncbi:hypothetical protein [Streptomyces sp. NPDC059708]|uniref:hypothetical protein n=1 Tax=Streptomyces sp. NPDC059708 TaxID=3346916 RepID=UPI00369FD9C5
MSTATTELGRFLTLAGLRHRAGEPAPEMFSGAVDAAWHQALEDEGYPTLCAGTAGELVNHAESGGHGPIIWISAYEAAYGPLPDIWFTDADGHLDAALLTLYRETGTVTASWNCGPEFTGRPAETSE